MPQSCNNNTFTAILQSLKNPNPALNAREILSRPSTQLVLGLFRLGSNLPETWKMLLFGGQQRFKFRKWTFWMLKFEIEVKLVIGCIYPTFNLICVIKIICPK